MLTFLPGPLRGILCCVLLLTNLFILSVCLFIIAFFRLFIPFKRWRFELYKFLHTLTTLWVNVNNYIIGFINKITWDIEGTHDLKNTEWYLIICNHRSWTDIIVLQKIFNRKTPLIKFFMKQELLWMLPFGGLVCWILDFPFMKRYSKEKLKKNPELKNKDFETIQKACEKFKTFPCTVMNYPEGTRYTPQKQNERASPYQYLLRPRSAGIALVINCMRGYIKQVIDVTIVYCDPDPSFWKFLCGKVKKIIIRYDVIPISDDLYGDYHLNREYRTHIQAWLSQRWHQKDNLIRQLTEEHCS